jgi:AcrR family transcriptional regulator
LARERVFGAAMSQFAEKGLAETRVEDVVAAAEVAWGTFYRYFPRKEDVLLEAAVRYFQKVVLPLLDDELAERDRSSREKALRLLLAILEPGEYPRAVRGEIVKEVIERRERFSAMLGAGEHPLANSLARIVAQGQGNGEVRSDIDQFTLAGTLLAGTVFTTIYAFYGALRRTPPNPGLQLEPLLERVFDIIWRGLEPLPGEAGRDTRSAV